MTEVASNERSSTQMRRKPFLSPAFVKAMLAGHSALGLAFAALIYIVCITGTVCVFMHELNRWEQPDGPLIQTPLSLDAIGEAVTSGYAQAVADNAHDHIDITGPSALNPRLVISYQGHEGGGRGEWLADADGHLVTRVVAPMSEFVGALHMNLHLPRVWGMFLVGLTGVALLSSLLSGLLSHPRLFKDAFAFRWGGSKRLQEADIHNRLGVWGFPFHFVVTLAGALLGLSTLIVGVLALAAYDGDSEKAFSAILGPRAEEVEVAAPLPDIKAMIEAVKKERGDAVFFSANFQHPGHQGQIVHLAMRTPGHLAFANIYYFDDAGKSLGDGGLETGGIGQQILGVLQPLHFGWFGGAGIKFVYVLLGLALTVITQSGVVIWLARRRDKGRAVPVWERIWAAVVWSQPAALALTAITSLATGKNFLLPVYCIAVALSFALALLLKNAAPVRAWLQAAGAITSAALIAAYAIRWWGRATDPAAIYVSLAILAIAVLLAVVAWGTWRKFARATRAEVVPGVS
ncbi:hypothetical protein DLM45_03715 [Hyphomicrobium methylovorum]|uniref:PepSY-associated TM helix domain-containing protein n=1 Tax=Hyphomicrobium methylovorum TaxID=84 RepID=UPI0015E7332C|nr:PepSY-associated TM helix domain-containing protein [Hyphomicrobium methylovorum]MBA2125331.1 hypothetical protein [Hyphomicrobium methylovorum]